MTSDEMDTLLDDYLDGQLSAEEYLQFERALLEDPAVMDRLIAAASLHQLLQNRYAAEANDGLDTLIEVVGDPDTDADSRAVMDLVINQALADRRRHELEDEANRMLAAQQAQDARNRRFELGLHSAPEPVKRVVVIPRALIWLGLAAVLLLAATVFQLGDHSRPAVTNPPPVARQTPQPDAPAVVAPVAALGDHFDAAWLDHQPNATGELAPGTYTLTHGWAQIRTTHGVELVLESPVSFVINQDNEVTLSRGRLVADVPERAQGFTVLTPGGRVVDYGTTFGVAVDDRGTTLAHVFSGEIEVASSDDRRGRTLRLMRDEAASVPLGSGAQRSVAAPELFARQVPATAYQAAIMQSRPMCYWRGPIDETAAKITDFGWLGAGGQTSPSLRIGQAGFVADDPSGSLDFGRSGDAAVSLSPRQQFVFEHSFTIEAWVWIEPGHEDLMRIVSTRSANSGIGFGVNGQAGHDGIMDEPANVPVFTFFGEADFLGDAVLPEARWTHLAAVVDARGQVAMFVDGSQIAVRKGLHPVTTTGPATQAPLMIGRNPFAGQGTQAWQGRLDEVAIYDRALSPDEINEHCNALHSP